MAKPDHEDKSFVSVNIRDITPEHDLPCDIYLFINGHFLKFKIAGDTLPSDKYNQLLLKKTSHLFVDEADLQEFKVWAGHTTKTDLEQTLERVGPEHNELVEKNEAIKTEMLGIFTKEITNESIRKVLNKASEFIRKATHSSDTIGALRRIIGYSRTLADHSVNVANLSVYFAHFLKYQNQQVLNSIYLGALFHDIGKTRIDPELTEDKNPIAYKKAIRAHPELGKTLLLSTTDFTDEVLCIVSEHHERNDANGFPKKLSGSRISDLTKIVSIANYFDNLVSQADGELLQRQRASLKELKSDKGHLFDPRKLALCIEALEPGM